MVLALFTVLPSYAQQIEFVITEESRSSNVIPNQVAVDDSGNSYVFGLIDGRVAFGEGLQTQVIIGTKDLFVAKYDNDGNFIWVETFETNSRLSSAQAVGIGLDRNDLYVAGGFRRALFVGPNRLATKGGGTDGFIAQLDAETGLVRWANQISGRGTILVRALSVSAGGQSQFSAPVELRYKAGKKFNDLHDWILNNLNRPIAVEQMADRAAMRPRHFSRTFAKKTGITPGRYVELMRLDRAREMLESSGDPIALIAGACGFVKEDRLRRAFVRQLGTTPSQYRIHFNASHSANADE